MRYLALSMVDYIFSFRGTIPVTPPPKSCYRWKYLILTIKKANPARNTPENDSVHLSRLL